MNTEDVVQSISLLEKGLLEIEDILHKRKEESSGIALQELKNVLNDSEKDDEYNEEIVKLKKKYITSGSLENMLERIFNMTGYEDELEQLKNTEIFIQDSLRNETEILEKTLSQKIQKSHEILDDIKVKNNFNFNSKEREIAECIQKIKHQLQEKQRILDDLDVKVETNADDQETAELNELIDSLIRK
ncbi:hypothetical protein ACO0OL_001853 [Hanseniaspora opuntiae]